MKYTRSISSLFGFWDSIIFIVNLTAWKVFK